MEGSEVRRYTSLTEYFLPAVRDALYRISGGGNAAAALDTPVCAEISETGAYVVQIGPDAFVIQLRPPRRPWESAPYSRADMVRHLQALLAALQCEHVDEPKLLDILGCCTSDHGWKPFAQWLRHKSPDTRLSLAAVKALVTSEFCPAYDVPDILARADPTIGKEVLVALQVRTGAVDFYTPIDFALAGPDAAATTVQAAIASRDADMIQRVLVDTEPVHGDMSKPLLNLARTIVHLAGLLRDEYSFDSVDLSVCAPTAVPSS